MGRWREWMVWDAMRTPGALVALVPAVALLSYAVMGVWGLVVASVATPAALWPRPPRHADTDSVADMSVLAGKADVCLRGARLHGGGVCAMILHLTIDAPDPAASAIGVAGTLRSILRDTDQVWALPDGRLCVLVAARHGLSPLAAQALARRVQTAAEVPMADAAGQRRIHCALGLASAPHPGRALDGAELLIGAAKAARRATGLGPSGVVSADPPAPPKPVDMSLVIEARRALDTDQIVPWYQPQVCARTGRLTGVEALARWEHPQHGIIAPGGFLPALEQAGVGTQLGEVMLHHACAALQVWQAAGLHIPTVALNLSQVELAIPGLAQRIAWDLEAHGIAPSRLRIEILETVAVSGMDGVPGDNIAALQQMGCPIDLDDFGTGHATLTAVERFGVGRLKIDRSFVSGIDRDDRQARLVSAILAMAERMGVDTLAEGLETEAELRTLADLGCNHVQGFVVARPMPLPALTDWARTVGVVPGQASGQAPGIAPVPPFAETSQHPPYKL